MTAAALLGFTALGLQFLAYQTVMVGVVETIKRMLGLLSALVVGRVMFGEKVTPRTVSAVVVMGFGVVLLVG